MMNGYRNGASTGYHDTHVIPASYTWHSTVPQTLVGFNYQLSGSCVFPVKGGTANLGVVFIYNAQYINDSVVHAASASRGAFSSLLSISWYGTGVRKHLDDRNLFLDARWMTIASADRTRLVAELVASDSICSNNLLVSVARVEAQAEPRFHLVTFQVNDRRFVTGVDSSDDLGALCKTLADALQGDVIGYERIQWPDCPENGHHHILEMAVTGQWRCPVGQFAREAGKLCS